MKPVRAGMCLHAQARRKHPMTKAKQSSVSQFELWKLVRMIGFQLTAYIAKTNVVEVYEWLKHGLPKHLEERMQAVFDVASPIE